MTRHPILKFLDAKKFTAAHVCAATDINATSLTNFINKTDIELCSKKTGRGVGRNFCLIDVYMLALLNELTKTTKDYSLSVSVVNYIVFDVWRVAILNEDVSIKSDEELKEKFCCSIYNTIPEFYDRDLKNDWMLTIEINNGKVHTFRSSDIVHYLPFIRKCSIVISLTHFLEKIDIKLADMLWFDLDEFKRKKEKQEISRVIAKVLALPSDKKWSNDA